MKIISLRFANINSLAGEWKIRFDDDAFLRNRLFAISGPTGSGKTSILDAISLALYAMTSRQESFGKKNERFDLVMTTGADRSFSEVEFEASGVRYKAFWEASRKKKRGEISIVSDQKLLFEKNGDFFTDDGVSKKKEVGAKIVEIVGLDFSQFMRAVMLPQGSFDAFLKSSHDDKAKILEKLSGQGIYREISKKVFERKRDEENALNQVRSQIAQIQTLSESEERDLEAWLKNQNEIQTRKNSELKNYENSERILKERAAQEIVCKNLETNVSKLRAENVALKPSKERLINSQKAQQLAGILSELALIRASLAQNRAQYLTIEKGIPEQELSVKEREAEAEKLSAESKRLKFENADREKLREKVDSLDSEILGAKNFWNDRNESVRELKANLDARHKERLDWESAKKNLEESKEKCGQYLKENRLHENLEKISGMISDRLQQWNQAKISADSAKKNLNVSKSRLANAKAQLQAAEEKRKAKAQELDRLLSDDLKKVALFLQAQLKEGDFCPVCGGKFHAADSPCTISIGEAALTANRGVRLKKELDAAEDSCRNHEYEIKNAQYDLEHFQKDLDAAEVSVREKFAAAMELLLPYGILESELQSLQSVMGKIQQWISLWNLCKEKLDRVENDLQNQESKIRNLDEQIRNESAKQESLEAECADYLGIVQKKQAERENLFGTVSVRKDREDWRIRVEESDKEFQAAQKNFLAAEKNLQLQHNQLSDLSERLKSAVQKESDKLTQLDENLSRLGFESEEAARTAILSEEKAKELDEAIQKNETALSTEMGKLELANDSLKLLREKDVGQETLQTVQSKISVLSQELSCLSAEIDEKKKKKIENDLAKKNSQKLDTERLEREKTFSVWSKLNELIGAFDGKKFVEYVQRLTLQKLISAANRHLKLLSPRYRLESGGDELNISLYDSECGTSRLSANLSGGESFLVSLALALGLSSLASQKIRIDTLFLDEGFGTLDENRLQKAIDVLRNIGNSGDKLVGIISHVERLKEEISNHIEIVPIGNGRSQIVGPGVSAC